MGLRDERRAGELLLQVSSETKAGIKWIKVHEEGKQRQKRFEEANLGDAVEEAAGGSKTRSASVH